jgi:hypothetical protein
MENKSHTPTLESRVDTVFEFKTGGSGYTYYEIREGMVTI